MRFWFARILLWFARIARWFFDVAGTAIIVLLGPPFYA